MWHPESTYPLNQLTKNYKKEFMQLIVLASGRGSRLENYTNDKPKCLVQVRDKPIISYLKPAFLSFIKK